MSKKVLAILALVLALAVIGWQWNRTSQSRAPTTVSAPILVGAVLPLTGGLAFLGSGERIAMGLAVADVNARPGGPRLDIAFEDSKSTSRDGVTAAQKLLAAKPAAMVTSLTIVSLAANPILADAGVAQLALSVHPQITASAANLFRPYYGFETEMRAIADFVGKSGAKRVAALWINVPESQVAIDNYLTPALRAPGGDVVASLPFGFDTRDFKPLMAAIAAKRPDALVVIDFGNMVASIVEAARLQGIQNIIGSVGFVVTTPDGIKAVTGLPFAVPAFLLEENASFNAFRDRFKAASGGLDPNFDAVAAYDAVMLIAAGVQKVAGPVDAKSLLAALSTVREFNGIAGPLKMNDDRNMTVPIAFATFSAEGKLQRYTAK
jgi:branched-chain amino acid transport system substrate-binding protein